MNINISTKGKTTKIRVVAINRITKKRMNEKWVREVTRRELDKQGCSNYELWLQAEKSWGFIYTMEDAPSLEVIL